MTTLHDGFSFQLPTTIEYGAGVRRHIARALETLDATRVLLVTDNGVIRSGLTSGITDVLDSRGVRWEIFDGVEPNPKDLNVHRCVEAARDLDAHCLIAVGGGSPIDCAKAVSAVFSHGGDVRSYEGSGTVPGETIPLIAIPTTAGTGSEVTFSSVITDSKEKFKFSIRDVHIAPAVALIDPELTVTMPPALTAATGMDALTHAIEAYTCRVSEPLSDACALHAVELIMEHIRAACVDGTDLNARAGMLLGSVLAGIAFSHSDVAAVHCIAEALGGKYDAPHGVCNAVVLPTIMEYNMGFCTDRYARIASAMGITYTGREEGARRAVEAVARLADEVGLPPFTTLGVREEDLDEIARNSAVNGSNKDNPRPMGEQDYLAVLKRLCLG